MIPFGGVIAIALVLAINGTVSLIEPRALGAAPGEPGNATKGAALQ